MSTIPYFIFNNIDSRDMGVVVRALPPIVRPTERITQVTVPGRHGKLIMTEGDAPVYDNYVKTIDCYVRPDVDIEALLDWLRGSGRVIFSNEPDRAYSARIYSQISLEKIMRGHRHRAFAVSFLCDPVKGQAIPDPPVSVDLAESHGRLYNPGNIPAKPLITVTATGAFSLIVGAVLITNGGISYYGDPDGTHTFSMANTTGETVSEATVVIDADAEIVTSADGTTNLTVFSTGPFPTIDPGFCNIAWSGNISSLTITPRWRWI